MVIVNSIMASLHHILAFTLTAALVYEFVAYRKGLTIAEARRIQRADLVYGIAAGLLIVVGLLRVYFFEKGPNYYFYNHIFWTKMVLFVIVGLLSVYPTIRYIQWGPALKQGTAPEIPDTEFKNVRRLLWLEMTGLLLILFAAPLMARGVGIG